MFFHRAVFQNVFVLEMFHLKVHLAAVLDLPQMFKLLAFIAFLGTFHSRWLGRYPNLATAKTIFTTEVHLIVVLEILIASHELPRVKLYRRIHSNLNFVSILTTLCWVKSSLWQLTKKCHHKVHLASCFCSIFKVLRIHVGLDGRIESLF